MSNVLRAVPNQVGDGIQAGKGDWSFSGDVSKTFVPHIKRSVPHYEEGHEVICALSDFFVGPSSLSYEIGVSTGELIRKLATHNSSRSDARWIGIDIEEPMVNSAREHCQDLNNVEILLDDVVAFPFERADFIVSYYCLQFIPPKDRQFLIKRLYQVLNPGGALVLFEKVRAPDARFQDIASALYADFKTAQKYSDTEIMAKSRSLRGILEPLTSQGNVDLLRRGGFEDIWTIMKYVCFEGMVAVK